MSKKTALRAMSGAIPAVTHTQAALLSRLSKSGEVSGVCLRTSVQWDRSKPAFYMLMGRMEESGLICSRYLARLTDRNGPARDTIYAITSGGLQALADAREFYKNL